MKSKFLKYFFLFSIIMVTITANVNAESKYLYDVLKTEAESGGLAKEYTGEHHDSFTEEPSKKIYHWYATNDDEGDQVLEKNNVIFGGFCWQIIRTTDTGGTKIIYNGVSNAGKCNNYGSDASISKAKFNNDYKSITHVGYKYNPDAIIESSFVGSIAEQGSRYGGNISYSNGLYHLMDVKNRPDKTHRFTCGIANATECESVLFFHFPDLSIKLTNGLNVERLLNISLTSNDVNKEDSNIKKIVDQWYENNLINYESKIEDTIFCGNRNIRLLYGWDISSEEYNRGYLVLGENSSSTKIICSNETDKYSISNNKAQLKYPIALATKEELNLLNNNKIRETGETYWLINPDYYNGGAINRYINYNGDFIDYSLTPYVNNEMGVRPVISLKQNTKYLSGNGSKNNPYIIDTKNFYKVIVEEDLTKGKIEFEIGNISNISEGELVKFKLIPIKEYTLKDLVITDAENNNIEYTTDNMYFSFIMPTSDVTIKPVYKKISENNNILTNPKTGSKIFILTSLISLIILITTIFVRKKKKFSSI